MHAIVGMSARTRIEDDNALHICQPPCTNVLMDTDNISDKTNPGRRPILSAFLSKQKIVFVITCFAI